MSDLSDSNLIKGKKPTINDVARLSGVSKKTVSRVINNSSQVTEATRNAVQAVMAQLNYAPDPQARGLAFKRSFLIGLVYDNPNAFYISDVQRGVLNAIRSHGFELIMHPASFNDPNLADDVTNFVTRSRVDGVILLSPISQLDDLAKRLQQDQVHYCRISPNCVDDISHTVISHDHDGAHLMAEHLLSTGHRRIGFVSGATDNLSSQQKLLGFIKAFDDLGIRFNDQLVVTGDHTFESGLAAGNQLLTCAEPPTAIFASNDVMAMGVMRAAAMLSIDVPSQLTVTGYDDSAIATLAWPELTTIHQPLGQIGAQAALKLVGSITGEQVESAALQPIQPVLKVRGSSRSITL